MPLIFCWALSSCCCQVSCCCCTAFNCICAVVWASASVADQTKADTTTAAATAILKFMKCSSETWFIHPRYNAAERRKLALPSQLNLFFRLPSDYLQVSVSRRAEGDGVR